MAFYGLGVDNCFSWVNCFTFVLGIFTTNKVFLNIFYESYDLFRTSLWAHCTLKTPNAKIRSVLRENHGIGFIITSG